MKKELLYTIKAFGGLIVIILAIMGIIHLFSLTLDRGPEIPPTLITDASRFQMDIEGTPLLTNFDYVVQQVVERPIEDTTEVRALVMNGVIAAQGYTSQYNWLYAPTVKAIEILNTLKKEGQLLVSCYSKLSKAWFEKESGNDSAFNQYCDEAQQLYEQALSLRAENRIYLNTLLSQIESSPQ